MLILSLCLSPLCLLLCPSIIVLLRAHNFRTRAEFDFYFYCQFSLWCDVFQQLFHLNPVNVIRFSVTNNQLTITNYTKIHCVHSSDNYMQIMVSEMGGMHECVILFFFSLLFNSLAPKTNINSMRIAFCKWPAYLIALFYLVRNWTISPVSLQSTRYVDSSWLDFEEVVFFPPRCCLVFMIITDRSKHISMHQITNRYFVCMCFINENWWWAILQKHENTIHSFRLGSLFFHAAANKQIAS